MTAWRLMMVWVALLVAPMAFAGSPVPSDAAPRSDEVPAPDEAPAPDDPAPPSRVASRPHLPWSPMPTGWRLRQLEGDRVPVGFTDDVLRLRRRSLVSASVFGGGAALALGASAVRTWWWVDPGWIIAPAVVGLVGVGLLTADLFALEQVMRKADLAVDRTVASIVLGCLVVGPILGVVGLLGMLVDPWGLGPVLLATAGLSAGVGVLLLPAYALQRWRLVHNLLEGELPERRQRRSIWASVVPTLLHDGRVAHPGLAVTGRF